ncbi:uncharacterized protein LOC129410609 [Boleophthalmus pectinirostris]|uniref:uncharacterized protein LOC129410609 n=1 Tax=Boleophthalmus pectinirostris TaxID=150288 RepID=UPI0024308249|nr:uncharacterized protein LOC129410609 [Boleophthalmus pectinirostris]
MDHLSSPASCFLPRCSKGKRGIDRRNIRELARAQSLSSGHTKLRLALLNTRSLANKTFLLNDFFVSRDLDYLFLTETWLREGECSAFSELLPPGCTYFNSPRSSGKGGGLATVFKSSFQCCQSSNMGPYSSFELQLLNIQASPRVVCAVIYRPPKFNKRFIQEFSDFLAGIVTVTDHLLIAGDLNVHVCCETKPLAKEFLSVIDSFNLRQWISGPTHEKGHTLDLVLTLGLDVCVEEICDMHISDHLPILFNIELPGPVVKQDTSVRTVRAFTPLTVEQFSCAFASFTPPALTFSGALSAEELNTMFNTICTDILDAVAPLVMKRAKPTSEPWLNETTRALRRECRRAESGGGIRTNYTYRLKYLEPV